MSRLATIGGIAIPGEAGRTFNLDAMSLELRTKELRETEDQACLYLRNVTSIPSAPDLTEYRSRCRFWRFPAFDAYQSWSVFESRPRRKPLQPIARRVTWDRPFDCRRLLEPLIGLQEGFHSRPKIEVRDRPVEVLELGRRFEEAHSISIPIVDRNSSICLDGAMFGYEEREGGLHLEWCCDGTAEWREFTTWAGEMMRWLDENCTVKPDVDGTAHQ